MANVLSLPTLFTLVAAIGMAAIGGAAFLRGVLGVSEWLRLPRFLVASTLAAFATSSPEMAVSSYAALSGKPGIGLGDALGSNVVNVGLILGIALLFGPLVARFNQCRRDFLLALAAPLLTLLLALDGTLSRTDGVLLLVLFAVWLTLVSREAIALRRAGVRAATPASQAVLAMALLLVGLVALILAGQWFVSTASDIAQSFGVHPYVIGATLVAIGTSMPELVTVGLARLRGHDDIGLGTVLGSNLFNGLAVVGTAASLQPIQPPLAELGVAVAFGVITVMLVLPKGNDIPRSRGIVLIAAYGTFAFLAAILAQ